MGKSKTILNKTIILKIIFILLSISILIATISTFFLKNLTLNNFYLLNAEDKNQYFVESIETLNIYYILFFIILLITFAILLSFLINKKILSPLQSFSQEIKKVLESGNLENVIVTSSNIEEISSLSDSFNSLIKRTKLSNEKLFDNLYTDSLTRLPNFVKLNEDIKKNEYNSLMVIDIDSFRKLNNFYGVKVGDVILKQLAMYLREKTRYSHKVYRLFGDEFAILTQEKITVDYCKAFIKSLNNIYYIYNDTDIYIQSSLGVVFDTKERIVEKATIAVRNAKIKKTIFEEFDNSLGLQEEYEKHITWSANIKKAIENDDITVYFQAIKDVKKNIITKYECLARMFYEEKTYSPDIFLGISKNAKQYPIITKKIIEKSFLYFKTKKDIEFSINLSIDDIVNEETMEYLFEMLKKYQLGHRLIIELLESEEINDFSLVNAFIKKVKEFHVKIAIDDFGSGYSNFSYIVNLKVDYLKIDSSLIENIDKNEDSRIIAKSIVDFARNIGVKTIAEKVHSAEIERIIIDLGVDFVQGYYIGKPKSTIDAIL